MPLEIVKEIVKEPLEPLFVPGEVDDGLLLEAATAAWHLNTIGRG